MLIEASGAALEKLRERLNPTSVEDIARAARRGIEILHSYGITAFQDAAATVQLMQALKRLDEQGELHAWVVTSMLANDFVFGAARVCITTRPASWRAHESAMAGSRISFS